MTFTIATLFRGGERRRRIRASELRRRRRRAGPILESCEQRVLMAGPQWDLVGTAWFDSSKSPLQYINKGSFVNGQRGKLEVTYYVGGQLCAVPDHTGSLRYWADGKERSIGFRGASGTFPGEFVSTGGAVRMNAIAPEHGHFVKVDVYAQRLANLVALAPTLNANGSVSYGYKIDGDTAVLYRGYVEVELFYASGPSKSQILDYAGAAVSTPRPIAHHNLTSNPGNPITFNVAADWFQKNPPPAKATHLVAIIDRKNEAAEFNESDADNVKAIALPNLYVADPKIAADGTFTLMFGNTSTAPAVTNAYVTAALYYAKGPNLGDILGQPFGSTSISLGPKYVSAPFSVVPTTPPAGATHVLAVIDRQDKVRESNESDNVKALKLPDLSVTSIEWDDSGGIKVKYKVSDSATWPSANKAGITFYWATGPKPDDRIIVGAAELPRAAVSRKDNEYELKIPASRIKTPADSVRDLLSLDRVTKLQAVIDYEGILPEASESNNVVSVELGKVSDELSDAPGATAGADRVRLWTRKNERLILAEARAFNVDPRVIAGIIAWEALYNDRSAAAGSPIVGYGPGKVHWHNATKYFGIINGPDFVGRGVAEEVEDLGYVSPPYGIPTGVPKGLARAQYLRTPEGAVKYIAAILRGYSDVLLKHGYDASVEPDAAGVLATLYWGVGIDRDTITEYDAWFAANPGHRPSPASNPKGMGGWVDQNVGTSNKPKYVDSLLKATYKPRNRSRPLPKPRIDQGTTRLNQALSMAVLDNDDAMGQSIAIAGFTQGLHGTVARDLNRLVYTPAAGFVGDDSFFYTLNDGKEVVAGSMVKVKVRDLAPAQLRAIEVKSDRATLAWVDQTATEDHFVIERSADGGRTWRQQENVPANATRATVTGLEPSRTYDFRVVAVLRNGDTETSDAVTVTTTDGRPAAPTNLRADNVWPRKIDLRWDDRSDNETEFRVAISRNGGATWDNVGVVGANVTNLRLEGLDPLTPYLFRVRAGNSAGYSDYSNTLNATTGDDAPANLRTDNVHAYSVDLRWDDRSGEETEFRVAISSNGGATWDNAGVVGANATTLRVDNLTPSTQYLFKVRGTIPGGYTGYSNIIDVTTKAPPVTIPVAPANLRADNIWPRKIDLRWDDRSDNETEFRVAISRNGGATWDNVGVVGANVTNLRLEGLDPLTPYLFQVRAGNSAGYSDYSNTLNATTGDDSPANLRTDNVHAYSVDLRWDDRSGEETEFRVAISRNGGATWDNAGVVGANATTLRVDNLSPSTQYLFKVRGTIPGGYTGYSNIIDVTTKAPPVTIPAAPANLRADNVWPRTIDLRWDDRSDNETEFRVAISRNGGATWDNVGVVGANVTSFRVTDLNPSTRYLFRVRAGNSAGYSDYSNILDLRTKA